MPVTVKLFATFRQGRFEREERELAPGATTGDLVDGLAIRRAEVGVLLVNGRHAGFDRALAPGETVSIFPLIGGG